jgi:hypothetical protein
MILPVSHLPLGVPFEVQSQGDGFAPLAGKACCSHSASLCRLTPDKALWALAGQYFATVEEAAWEQDLQRLELGYEAEGYYNFKLQLGQE